MYKPKKTGTTETQRNISSYASHMLKWNIKKHFPLKFTFVSLLLYRISVKETAKL